MYHARKPDEMFKKAQEDCAGRGCGQNVQSVPTSGNWSGSFYENGQLNGSGYSLIFTPEGTVSGSTSDKDGTSNVNGFWSANEGRMFWMETHPSRPLKTFCEGTFNRMHDGAFHMTGTYTSNTGRAFYILTSSNTFQVPVH